MSKMTGNVLKVLKAFVTRKIRFEVDLIPFAWESLALRKISNWLLTETSVFFKPARPWGFPTILQIEPTARCNLQCKACPVATGLKRQAGDMDLPMFRRVIDELANYLLLIMFWDWGEPFLNPEAFEMIKHARRKGVRVMCSTNGHIFAHRDYARKVVDCGLDVLVFSVDGITEETYQRYRTGGRLETVLEGIKNVVAAKRTLHSHTPRLNFRFIVMKHCEHEIPQLKQFAASLGVDVLTLRKFHFVPGTEREFVKQAATAGFASGDGMVPSNVKYQLPAFLGEGKHPLRVTQNPCKNLWNCATIHWDGTVCSCFMDYKEQRPLGSLKKQGFREIWYGAEYRQLRRAFREKWEELALCRECASGFQGGAVGREATAEVFFFPESQSSGSVSKLN